MTWSGYSENGQGSVERGPGSFANDAPRPVIGQASDRAGSAQVRGGVQFIGRGTSSVGSITPGDDRVRPTVSTANRTLSVLMELGEKTLAPRIQQMKNEAEVRGAAEFASGKALEEIVNEQPWYANVFGDAPAVEGARVYAAKAATAKFVQGNLERMEELAVQSPDALTPALISQIDSHLTGDAATDSVIRGELLAQMPTLVKAHTKAHVAYMQKKADSAHRGAMSAMAEQYGAVMSNGDMFSDDDRAGMESRLAEAFALPDGRNPDSHWKNITEVVIEQATKGNSHFLAASMRAGMVEAMPPDYRDVVKTGISRAAPGVFAKVVASDVELMTAVAALNTDPPETPAEIHAEWEKLNDAVALRSGIPRELVSFLGTDDLLRATGFDMRRDEAAENAVEQDMRREREALQKTQDAAVRKSMYATALFGQFNDPKVNLAQESGKLADQFGLTTDDINSMWREQLGKLDAPSLGRVLNRVPADRIPVVKERLRTWMSAAMRPEARDAYEGAWGQLIAMASEVDTKVLALHIEDDAFASDVKAVQQMVASGTAPLAAVGIVRVEGAARRAASRWAADVDDDKKAASRAVVDEVVRNSIGKSDSFRNWRTMFGGRKPDEYQIGMLSALVASGDSGLLGDKKAGAQLSLNRMLADGDVTVGGGGVVTNTDGKDAKDYQLTDAIGLARGNSDGAHEALFVLAEAELRKRGYGMTRSGMSHVFDVATRIASPIQSALALGQIPRDAGFEATGYTAMRLPRRPGEKDLTYAITYTDGTGTPKQLFIDSTQVRKSYDDLVGKGRTPLKAPAGSELLDDPTTQDILQQNLK